MRRHTLRASVPELPDIEAYVAALDARITGRTLRRIRIASPFLLRTVTPPLASAEGQEVARVWRLGKRIVISTRNDIHLILHLMIAGRLQWKPPGARAVGRIARAAFEFDGGTLLFTEAGSKQRASLHMAEGDGWRAHDPGGLEPLEAPRASLAAALRGTNRTLKRALTDPGTLAGIGNAYSDEILHAARLSPTQLTQNLSDEDMSRLLDATQVVLREWTERLRAKATKAWPSKVTAFQPGFAVHGRYGEPCPECGTNVQRIVKGENESNYCPRCQTGGRMLADRALSKLLRDDWPDTVEAWETRQETARRAREGGA